MQHNLLVFYSNVTILLEATDRIFLGYYKPGFYSHNTHIIEAS